MERRKSTSPCRKWQTSTPLVIKGNISSDKTCVCICEYVCIYIYIHTHIHTHIYAFSSICNEMVFCSKAHNRSLLMRQILGHITGQSYPLLVTTTGTITGVRWYSPLSCLSRGLDRPYSESPVTGLYHWTGKVRDNGRDKYAICTVASTHSHSQKWSGPDCPQILLTWAPRWGLRSVSLVKWGKSNPVGIGNGNRGREREFFFQEV